MTYNIWQVSRILEYIDNSLDSSTTSSHHSVNILYVIVTIVKLEYVAESTEQRQWIQQIIDGKNVFRLVWRNRKAQEANEKKCKLLYRLRF